MRDLNIKFSPTRGLNKKVYTPDYIEDYGREAMAEKAYLDIYDHHMLLEYLIINDKAVHLSLCLKDYPFLLNDVTFTGESLIHSCITYNAIQSFQILKMLNIDFDRVGLCEMNVYQESLYKPIFWDLAYGHLSDNELYEKLTKPLSCCGISSGVFEIMFANVPERLEILKKFWKFNKKVLYQIIDEYFDNNMIKCASGETKLIVTGYYNMDKELEEAMKDMPFYNQEIKIVKF